MRTAKTYADHEGIYAVILEDGHKIAGAYEFVAAHGSWERAKKSAILVAQNKADMLNQFGPPPADEEKPLEGDGLRAV